MTACVMAKTVPYSGFRMVVVFDAEDGERPRAILVEKNESEPTYADLEPSFCDIQLSESSTTIFVDGNAVVLSNELVAFYAESGQPTKKVLLDRKQYRKIAPGTIPKLPELWNLCLRAEGEN